MWERQFTAETPRRGEAIGDGRLFSQQPVREFRGPFVGRSECFFRLFEARVYRNDGGSTGGTECIELLQAPASDRPDLPAAIGHENYSVVV